MRIINDYNDFLSALKDKNSNDWTIRNEASFALAVLKQKKTKLFNEFTMKYEGIEPSDEPSETQKEANSKEESIQKHPKINIEEVRKKARECLVKGKHGLGLRFGLPVWISEENVLISLDLLDLSDLITSSNKLVRYDTLQRRCIKRAVVDGRIDKRKVREFVLSHCKSPWNIKSPKYPLYYSYETVKWFVKDIATTEELADVSIDAKVDFSKLFGLLIKKGIKEPPDKEIIEKNTELKEHREEQVFERPQNLKKLAHKAFNYIEKHSKAQDGFPLPDNCELEDLKKAIDSISDDDLFSIYNGKRIEADKLYELCIRVLMP